jgi:hypothetical protein
VRLQLAFLLMWSPSWLWSRLPARLRSWAVDQWLWSVQSVRDRYPSRAAFRRALDALDPGGV